MHTPMFDITFLLIVVYSYSLTDVVQSARQGRRAAQATPAVDLEQDDDLDTPLKPDVSELRLPVLSLIHI